MDPRHWLDYQSRPDPHLRQTELEKQQQAREAQLQAQRILGWLLLAVAMIIVTVCLIDYYQHAN